MLYKKKVNPRFPSKLVGKLLAELKELIIVSQENFYYVQEF